MRRKTPEPAQFEIEFRPGSWIAVRQIQTAYQQAGDGGLDIAAVHVVGIAGEAASGFDRSLAAREDGDAIPAFLTVPDGAITGISDLPLGNFSCGAFSSCRQTMSGAVSAEPAQS